MSACVSAACGYDYYAPPQESWGGAAAAAAASEEIEQLMKEFLAARQHERALALETAAVKSECLAAQQRTEALEMEVAELQRSKEAEVEREMADPDTRDVLSEAQLRCMRLSTFHEHLNALDLQRKILWEVALAKIRQNADWPKPKPGHVFSVHQALCRWSHAHDRLEGERSQLKQEGVQLFFVKSFETRLALLNNMSVTEMGDGEWKSPSPSPSRLSLFKSMSLAEKGDGAEWNSPPPSPSPSPSPLPSTSTSTSTSPSTFPSPSTPPLDLALALTGLTYGAQP